MAGDRIGEVWGDFVGDVGGDLTRNGEVGGEKFGSSFSSVDMVKNSREKDIRESQCNFATSTGIMNTIR